VSCPLWCRLTEFLTRKFKLSLAWLVTRCVAVGIRFWAANLLQTKRTWLIHVFAWTTLPWGERGAKCHEYAVTYTKRLVIQTFLEFNITVCITVGFHYSHWSEKKTKEIILWLRRRIFCSRKLCSPTLPAMATWAYAYDCKLGHASVRLRAVQTVHAFNRKAVQF